MPENMYQETLFSDHEISRDEPPGHFFYVVTNMFGYKTGHAADVPKRMKKDSQFRGTLEVGKISCNCEPWTDSKGRKHCELEIAWENAHASSRLPNGEWYIHSADVKAALCFLFGDPRALAIIDRVERNIRRDIA